MAGQSRLTVSIAVGGVTTKFWIPPLESAVGIGDADVEDGVSVRVRVGVAAFTFFKALVELHS